MNDNIEELEDYRNNLENKKKIDSNEITLDYLDLEQVEGLKKLYIEEIKKLDEEIKELKKKNMMLKNKMNEHI